MNDGILTVTQTNDYLNRLIATDPFLASVTVRGEISNFKLHTSGHMYFSLKDEQSLINCVMYRYSCGGLTFSPKEGDKVVVSGSIGIYAKQGKYQISVDRMRREGAGDLYIKFEQLKRRLFEEGLFDSAAKKPLPLLPRRVGLVTSETGAAVRDMIRVLRARIPNIDIVLCPVAVQGTGAAEDIARGVRLMDKFGNVDVMLVGRGGGSIEDLWAFNEEIVARAVYNAETPVISCVGHEVDTTIIDYVSDVRAATPSNAAEIAVPVSSELYAKIDTFENRLKRAMLTGQSLRRAKLERLTASPCLSAPREMWIVNGANKLEKLVSRLGDAWEKQQLKRRASVDVMTRTLNAMDPEGVLVRGYAYVEQSGRIVQDAAAIDAAGDIRVHMRDGSVTAAIKTREEN